MNIIKAVSNLVVRALTLTTESLESVEKAIVVGNHYVSENSKQINVKITENAQMSLSEHRHELASQLEKNPKLGKQFEQVQKEWNSL